MEQMTANLQMKADIFEQTFVRTFVFEKQMYEN